MKNQIYLDHAAATPVDPTVLKEMLPFLDQQYYNPSSIYLAGRDAKKHLYSARKRVAHWLGSKPDEIIFTAGATESDNLAIHGVMKQFIDAKVAVSAIEHEAVIETAAQYNHQMISVDSNGRVSKSSLISCVTDKTVLISIMYANNEIGTIQPISDLARVVDEIRQQRKQQGNKLPLYLHTDATQAANYLDLHVNRLGIDLLTLNAGKIYGPKQVGILYVRGGTKLVPTIFGGGQERNIRSGTENLAGATGMAAALDLVQKSRSQESKRLMELRAKAEDRLQSEIEDLILLGGKRRLPNNLTIMLPGLDGERAVMELDENGIQCSTGSACSALTDESSHVIRALGYDDQQSAATIRLTLGRTTDQPAIDRAVSTIIKLYKNKRH